MTKKIFLLAHTCQAFSALLSRRLGRGAQHAAIFYRQFCQKGAFTGDPSFNNAQNLLEEIYDTVDTSSLTVIDEEIDQGTHKLALRTSDKKDLETVFIPMKDRGTLCVSSQVGCRQGCAFCETAKMGWIRNLKTEEIVSQVFVARFEKKLSFNNVVFMGMGEPFDNLDAVLEAAKVLSDPKGFGFGFNHITLSTSGDVAGIERLAELKELPIHLAISLNAPNDALRSCLMPGASRYDMKTLHRAIADYNQKSGRPVMIAYVLLAGVNDSLNQADELFAYLKGLDVRVNLIAYNPGRRGPFRRPSPDTVEAFKKRLQNHGLQALFRPSRGEKISAGCGQLIRRQNVPPDGSMKSTIN